ncbi:MAG TPA: arylesterase [Pseudomonadales bacterium]|nr:arylesterase [Pseudomonadales bacterium]HNN87419.1 arylesterase [Pseudomonadales bacterium]
MLKKDYLWQRVFFVFVFFCLAAVPVRASTVLVFGDSLSAAYGMREEEGWVALLQKTLPEHQFVNESVSGEISANGLKRLPDALKKHKPDVLVIELGANDGLRGMPIALLRNNLQAMISLGKQVGCRILLLGMQLPPNYGMRYVQEFSEVYPRLAQENRIAVIPFFLQDIAGDITHFQPDHLHPTANVQPEIMATVRPVLLSLLRKK